jgi:hypothetical protein
MSNAEAEKGGRWGQQGRTQDKILLLGNAMTTSVWLLKCLEDAGGNVK